MEYRTASLESEAGFRVLFECATISILVVSERGEIELANPCAEALFGYEPAELIGKPVEILIPEGLRSKHKGLRENYFQAPKARPMGLGLELYARKKNSEVFPVAISLGHYELEGQKLAFAFITDITDHVKAGQLASEREKWFRNMADNSPVMIWVSGTDGECTYFNNTWLAFTGRKLEDELGSGWADGVHPEDLARCVDLYKTAFNAREPFAMEYRLRHHHGEYRWILDVGKPTYIANTFTGFIGSCADVHDQRIKHDELEAMVTQRTIQLNETLRREKEVSELKSRFISMASHEFRTPLSVILSSVSLIEQYSSQKTDKSTHKHFGRIRSSVNNLINILNDFLSLDKLEQGVVDIDFQSFAIFDFIKDIIDELQVYKRKGQQINFTLDGSGNVILDQKKMRYIVSNLLSNSIKYSPEDSQIQVAVNIQDKELSIRVKDNGIGIPEEDQKYMFNRFFRAKNTGSIQGTGLGLTIVKRYVELMDGTLSFTSKQGAGTEFIILLPQTARPDSQS